MKCIKCEHIDLATHPKHSEVGFALCPLKDRLPGGVVVLQNLMSDRQCDKFEQTTDAEIQARREWWMDRK